MKEIEITENYSHNSIPPARLVIKEILETVHGAMIAISLQL
jgi:hypothetical protein